jgi:hypothetical protein
VIDLDPPFPLSLPARQARHQAPRPKPSGRPRRPGGHLAFRRGDGSISWPTSHVAARVGKGSFTFLVAPFPTHPIKLDFALAAPVWLRGAN